MKKQLLILLFVALSLNAVSQNSESPKVTFTAGYGLVTVPQIIEGVSDILTTGITGGQVYFDDAKFSGAIILGMKFKVNDKLTLGVDGIYEKFTKKAYSTSNNNHIGTSKGSYVTVLPRADYYWLNGSLFRLYSGVGLGVSFAQQKFENDKDSKTILAFNATPIGTEIGTKFCVFGEASFGYNGLLSMGLRLRL